jgi:hypothetical protein
MQLNARATWVVVSARLLRRSSRPAPGSLGLLRSPHGGAHHAIRGALKPKSFKIRSRGLPIGDSIVRHNRIEVFPALPGRNARATNHWHAWVGDKDALERLASCIDDFMAEPRRAYSVEIQDDSQRAATGLTDEQQRQLKVWTETRGQEVDTTMILVHSRIDRGMESGTFLPQDEVLPTLDPRAPMSSLTFQAPKDRTFTHRVDLRLSRVGGVELEVWGPTTWTTAARQQLRDEVKKGVPWWARLRSFGFIPLYAVIAAFVSAGAAWPGSRKVTEHGFAAFSGLVGPTSLLLTAGFVLFARWRLPGFELTAGGDRGFGSRLMDAVVLLLATGALTVALAVVAK